MVVDVARIAENGLPNLQRRGSSIVQWVMAAAFSLLVSVSLSHLIALDLLSRIVKVEVAAESSADEIFFIQYHNNFSSSREFDDSDKVLLYRGGRRQLDVNLPNAIAPWLRFSADTEAEMYIYSVTVKNYLAKPMTYGARELVEMGLQGKGVDVSLEGARVALRSVGGARMDVNLMSPVRFHNPWLQYALPSVIGLALLILLGRADFRRIPAIKDLQQVARRRQYRLELDGVRGIAALLVLLEHSWAPFLGAGRTGVWWFFILSGYLLSQPFVSRPERATNISFLGRYYLRRLARILPMYWLMVFLIFGLNGGYDHLPGNLLLLTAEGHLWTIPQEVFFYLILPVVMLGAYFLFLLNPRASVFGIAGLTGALLLRPELIPVELYALGKLTKPFVGWFALGILIAYLNPTGASTQAYLTSTVRKGLSVFSTMLFIGVIALSIHGVGQWVFGVSPQTVLPLAYGVEFGVACAALLYLILLLPGSMLTRLISLPVFRAVGIVGYSYYLLHPTVIQLINGMYQFYYPGEKIAGFTLALLAGMLTWLAAAATYSLVERPFIRAASRSR